jgi:signal peptidase I
MKKRKILFLNILNLLLILFLIVVFLPLTATISLPLKFYQVLGISMLPTIKGGDMILEKEGSIDKIKVGDIISFSGNKNKGIISRIREKGIVHRVIEIDRNPRLMFLTKGDNNDEADGWITADFVDGKVIWIIPTRFLFRQLH